MCSLAIYGKLSTTAEEGKLKVIEERFSIQRRFLPLLIAGLMASSAIVLAEGASGSGTVSIINSAPILQNFDTLSNSTTPSNVLPTGWYLTEIGTGGAADGSYVVGTGSSNAGGAYSFGATSSTDRALGSVGSGTVTPVYFGAKFTNNSTGPVTALAIEFNGEMWRRGPATAADGLTFAYSTSAGSLKDGTYTNLAGLNFASLGNACSAVAGATDGNSSACRTHISRCDHRFVDQSRRFHLHPLDRY